jgi:alkanesulfonate monooxygenase SsuD/methylene tetrahydromethanopterin reductase-like flavin-dependent oxidoreductase (luciferase family)
VWVAATSPSTVEIAAERGLPLLLGMHNDDTAKAAMLARYADAAVAAGQDPAGPAHASAHLAHVADTVEQAETALRAALPDGWPAPASTCSGHPQQTLDTITRLGAEVLPALRRHPTPR